MTDRGTLLDTTPEMFEFLRACVKARLNIFVSGGTGSGKTTFLNVVSSFIPNDERIVTTVGTCAASLTKRGDRPFMWSAYQ